MLQEYRASTVIVIGIFFQCGSMREGLMWYNSEYKF